VIDNLLAAVREEYRRALIVTICAAVIAAAAMVAMLFVGVAIFLWISTTYGAVPACSRWRDSSSWSPVSLA